MLRNCAYIKFTIADVGGRASEPDSTYMSGSEARPPVPSTAHQLLTQAFHEIQQQPTADNALKAMPLLQKAMRRTPRNKNCQRYMDVV